MIRRATLAVTMLGVLGALGASAWTLVPRAAVAAPAPKTVSSHAATVEWVTLGIRHRVFQQFSEVQKVALQKEFPIGDTEYSARVVRYVPDFAMELKTGKVVSRSNEPRNPAFQIIVKENGAAKDTTWAFLNMPPHFARNSLLAFKIARIDFLGREPILADTTHAAPAAPAAKAPAAKAGTKP
jgi:hypothetical protein